MTRGNILFHQSDNTFLEIADIQGLIKKQGHTYKYYLTTLGKLAALTALKLRELVVKPA